MISSLKLLCWKLFLRLEVLNSRRLKKTDIQKRCKFFYCCWKITFS